MFSYHVAYPLLWHQDVCPASALLVRKCLPLRDVIEPGLELVGSQAHTLFCKPAITRTRACKPRILTKNRKSFSLKILRWFKYYFLRHDFAFYFHKGQTFKKVKKVKKVGLRFWRRGNTAIPFFTIPNLT